MLYRPIEFEPIYDDEGTCVSKREDKSSPHGTDDKNFPKTMNKMIDLSLFTNPVYVLFAISTFLTTIGYNTPILMPLRAEKLSFAKVDAGETVYAYGKK